jgi:hypothetical protein
MDSQDGKYDYTRPGSGPVDKPWQLTAEALSNARTWWNNGPPWSPAIPRTSDPHEMIPPRYGYRTEELTIEDVLASNFSILDYRKHAADAPATDFSGSTGGYEGTLRPTGAGGGGVT